MLEKYPLDRDLNPDTASVGGANGEVADHVLEESVPPHKLQPARLEAGDVFEGIETGDVDVADLAVERIPGEIKFTIKY